MKNMTHMKKALAVVVLPVLFAVASFAGDEFAGDDLAGSFSVAHWSRLVGVITSPGVSSTVAGIMSGTTPWTTTNGSATVNFSAGTATFSVQGLVLVGGDTSGTPGKVTMVKGTLVCNPGTSSQTVFDTPAVPLSLQGNATNVASAEKFDRDPASISTCNNPLFLIRVVPKNIWIATGAVRVITSP
jgi:hypothetical protein